ncbi:MAG: DUF4340 domain-containing protein [Variovorax sp.]
MNYVRAITYVGVALALSLAALLLLLARDDDATLAPPSVIAINRLPVSDIAAVAVTNGRGAYGFIVAPDGAIQLLAQPQIAGADDARDEMQAFIFQMSKLSASRALPSPGDLSPYGLAEPQAQVSLFLRDGRKLRLQLGHASPTGDQYYLRKEGDKQVFLIGKLNAELMLRARTDYLNRQLVPHIDAQTIDRLQSIRLQSRDEPATDWRIAHDSNGSFRLTQPVSAPVRTDYVFSQLLQGLSGLRADHFVSLADASAQSWSAPPAHRLELQLDGQRHQITFTPDGRGGYLVRRDADAAVFALARENAGFLSTTYRDLLGDHVYNTGVAALESVEFMRDAGSPPMELRLGGWGAQLSGTFQGRSVSGGQVDQALAPLFAIGIVAEVGHTPQALSQVQTALAYPPVARVIIRKRDGTQDHIEFFRKDDRQSFVRLNGAVDFITYTSAAGALEQSLMSLRPMEGAAAKPGS